ncbi:hypothetical protein LR48_Vigan06g097600 [Vigna angularis]|uniref:Uncharacterized protein n=1 Tax=Phaseolus angularis TaxID=3914 RepID=A0A0L9US20_PHAAN|nr:hypothetical protein LR48_Vigan06g097600 [Vigna angularis]
MRGEVGAFQGLLASHNAVAETDVEVAVVLVVDVALDREATDLATEASGKLGRVEAIDGNDATLSGKELLVITLDVVAEHGREAHSGDHHAFLGVLLALRGRDLGRHRGRHEEDVLNAATLLLAALLGVQSESKGEAQMLSEFSACMMAENDGWVKFLFVFSRVF